METIIEIPFDSKVVRKAQIIAEENNIPFNQLVNDLLETLVKHREYESEFNSLHPDVQKITNIKKANNDLNYKELLADALWEKYNYNYRASVMF